MSRHATPRPAARTVAGRLVFAVLVAACAAARADLAEPTLAEEAAFRAAVDRVAAAVVRIEPVASAKASAGGEAAAAVGPSTGVFVAADAAAAWLLTTDFAVPADVREAVVVRADGGRLAARVAGRDLSRRLVLLRTEAVPGLPALEPVPRRELAVGQWTIAVGRGWGHAAPGVSVGILSAADRAWGRAVQTDAAVSPANYGGPLLDVAGRVIGILAPLPADTAGMNEGTELYDAGIGFAVPLADIMAVLPRLQQGEALSAGLLGITWRSRDVVNGEPVIASCRQGSPAAEAGMRPGDRVVRIGQRDIERIGAARHEIMPRRAGDTIDLVVERATADGPRRLEMRMTLVGTLPPWRAAVLGFLPTTTAAPAAKEDEPGVGVEWLLPEGPAAAAGLQVGDVIRGLEWPGGGDAAGKIVIDTAAALSGALAGVAPGERVVVEMVRGGKPQRLEVTTGAAVADVPAIEGWQPAGSDSLRGPPVASVVRLESAEEPRPPLAVIPRPQSREPVGVLIYFGPPRGAVAEAEAEAWKAVAAAWDVAVILPGSEDPRRWGPDDLPAIRRGLVALDAKRPLDAARVAVAGKAAGGAFSWFVADRLGAAVRGVALLDSGLPRSAEIGPVEPGRSRWVLLGSGAGDAARLLAADRRRLEAAGYPVGTIAAEGDLPPFDLLARWTVLLGLL